MIITRKEILNTNDFIDEMVRKSVNALVKHQEEAGAPAPNLDKIEATAELFFLALLKQYQLTDTRFNTLTDDQILDEYFFKTKGN